MEVTESQAWKGRNVSTFMLSSSACRSIGMDFHREIVCSDIVFGEEEGLDLVKVGRWAWHRLRLWIESVYNTVHVTAIQ